MPAIPVGSILEFRVSYNANGQRLINTCHWRTTTLIPDNPLDTIYNEFGARIVTDAGGLLFVTTHRGCTAVNVIYESYALQFVSAIRYRAQTTQLVALAGTRVGDCTAQNVQGTIVKRTDIATRHGRGAYRVGGLSAADYGGGLLTAALQTQLGLLGTDLASSLATTSGWLAIPVVYQRPTKTTGAASIQIINTQVRSEVRTQRTRTVGRGI